MPSSLIKDRIPHGASRFHSNPSWLASPLYRLLHLHRTTVHSVSQGEANPTLTLPSSPVPRDWPRVKVNPEVNPPSKRPILSSRNAAEPQCNMPPVSVLSAVSCCRESADIRATRRLTNIPGEKERALIPPASPFGRQSGAQGLAGFLFHRRRVADEILPVRLLDVSYRTKLSLVLSAY
ncbi:unnamed protein product [Calypogeia fissa]